MCPVPGRDMASVFVEWRAETPSERCGMPVPRRVSCSTLHRVEWMESFIATGGGRQICHFRAPDAESVRLAYRQAGVHVDDLWTGAVRDAPGSAPATVVVEEHFAVPLPADADRAVAAFEADRLAPLGLRLVRAILPCHHRRIICICDGSNAGHGIREGVREVPGGRLSNGLLIWNCRRVTGKPQPDRTAAA